MKHLKRLLFLLILSVPGFAFSQEEKHEISFAYGFISHDQVLEVTEDILVQVFTAGYAVDKDYTLHVGPILVTYEFYPLKWMSTGIGFGLEYSFGDLIDRNGGSEEGTVTVEFKRTSLSMVYNHKFRYINKPVFQMYSGFAVGYTLKNTDFEMNAGDKEDQNENHMTLQINTIGFRFGKQIGGFFEFGYGYRGILNIGISGHF